MSCDCEWLQHLLASYLRCSSDPMRDARLLIQTILDTLPVVLEMRRSEVAVG